MPCYDGRERETVNDAVSASEHERVLQKLHTVTRLLCGLCKQIETDFTVEATPELYQWYTNHSAEDELQKYRDNILKKDYELKKEKSRILNKLSDEEKKILGLT